MDRFRSMPTSRTAVPLGRTAADLLGSAVGILLMAVIGLLAGWRAHHGLASTLAAFGLILLLRFAVSWIGVTSPPGVEPNGRPPDHPGRAAVRPVPPSRAALSTDSPKLLEREFGTS